MRSIKSPTERFLRRVSQPNERGCWLWTGSVNKQGYGKFSVRRRSLRAHRFAYEAWVGSVPEELCVLHECDTPACVNPAHLFVGTQKENIADMASKGRRGKPAGRGEQHRLAVLTEVQVRSIRTDSRRHREIAGDYGVASSQITRIKQRKLWAHVQ